MTLRKILFGLGILFFLVLFQNCQKFSDIQSSSGPGKHLESTGYGYSGMQLKMSANQVLPGGTVEIEVLGGVAPFKLTSSVGTIISVSERKYVLSVPRSAQVKEIANIEIVDRGGASVRESVQIVEILVSGNVLNNSKGFGRDVVLFENKILLADALNDDLSRDGGAIFQVSENSLGWNLEQIIRPPNGVGKNFGYSMAINNGQLIVGSPYQFFQQEANKETLLIYNWTGSSWELAQKMIDSIDMNTYSGSQISTYGDVLASAGLSYLKSTKVNIYERSPQNNWAHVQSLYKDEPLYGRSVFVGKEYIVVGLRYSAVIYRKDLNSLKWVQEVELSFPKATKYSDYSKALFGGDSVVFIGAPKYSHFLNGENCADCGGVFVYRFNGTEWSLEKEIVNNFIDREAHFGASLFYSHPFLYIGAPDENNENGIDAGAVYVFESLKNGWRKIGKLLSPSGKAADRFGATIHGDHEQLVVISPGKRKAQIFSVSKILNLLEK
ncbi:MAG: hypothetical protein KDD61_06980 [Bdellovibrionales bacterium]|nr:hypothetical protein [Bdellovibrionales bacterium]